MGENISRALWQRDEYAVNGWLGLPDRRTRRPCTCSEPAEAAPTRDLVVATAPFSAYQQLPGEALPGRIVIDTMNDYPQRDGRLAEVETGEVTTSELVQRHLTRWQTTLSVTRHVASTT